MYEPGGVCSGVSFTTYTRRLEHHQCMNLGGCNVVGSPLLGIQRPGPGGVSFTTYP